MCAGQTFQMLVDTGSAYTWIGANKTFVPGAGAVKYVLGLLLRILIDVER